MNKELIYKYLNNNCCNEESEIVINWFKYDAVNVEGQKLFKEIYDEYGFENDLLNSDDKLRILDKIHHAINLKKSESYFTTSKLKKGSVRFLSYLQKVAAILIIPLLTLSIYLYTKADLTSINSDKTVLNEVISPVGSRTKVVLPDGSEVWLNHGSKLIYPAKFTKKSRDVELEGEAFFNVVHNPKNPFIVHAQAINFKAVGTSFNVSAYLDDNVIETTLVDGKVIVQKHVDGKVVQDICEMKPNDHFEINLDDNKYILNSDDTEKYISWKNGVLVFKDDSIDDIVKSLSRWYNVNIIIQSEELKSYTYTATFIDETLIQILDLLKLATPIKYSVIPRKKLEDGTFSKTVIFINE